MPTPSIDLLSPCPACGGSSAFNARYCNRCGHAGIVRRFRNVERGEFACPDCNGAGGTHNVNATNVRDLVTPCPRCGRAGTVAATSPPTGSCRACRGSGRRTRGQCSACAGTGRVPVRTPRPAEGTPPPAGTVREAMAEAQRRLDAGASITEALAPAMPAIVTDAARVYHLPPAGETLPQAFDRVLRADAERVEIRPGTVLTYNPETGETVQQLTPPPLPAGVALDARSVLFHPNGAEAVAEAIRDATPTERPEEEYAAGETLPPALAEGVEALRQVIPVRAYAEEASGPTAAAARLVGATIDHPEITGDEQAAQTTGIIRGAYISDCGLYRYRLSRIWDAANPRRCGFLMLNPSTADGDTDDNTIRRCMAFARAWDFGGIEVANLFAYRATNPDELLMAADPIGPENGDAILDFAEECSTVVCAWGNNAERAVEGRAAAIVRMLTETGKILHCLGRTGEGAPRHPLYLPAVTPLEILSQPESVTNPPQARPRQRQRRTARARTGAAADAEDAGEPAVCAAPNCREPRRGNSAYCRIHHGTYADMGADVSPPAAAQPDSGEWIVSATREPDMSRNADGMRASLDAEGIRAEFLRGLIPGQYPPSCPTGREAAVYATTNTDARRAWIARGTRGLLDWWWSTRDDTAEMSWGEANAMAERVEGLSGIARTRTRADGEPLCMHVSDGGAVCSNLADVPGGYCLTHQRPRCPECGGRGRREDEWCPACGGTGRAEPPEDPFAPACAVDGCLFPAAPGLPFCITHQVTETHGYGERYTAHLMPMACEGDEFRRRRACVDAGVCIVPGCQSPPVENATHFPLGMCAGCGAIWRNPESERARGDLAEAIQNANPHAGTLSCSTCGGSGFNAGGGQPCVDCNGTGISPEFLVPNDCPDCNGTGRVRDLRCERCGGTGIPESDPDADANGETEGEPLAAARERAGATGSGIVVVNPMESVATTRSGPMLTFEGLEEIGYS